MTSCTGEFSDSDLSELEDERSVFKHPRRPHVLTKRKPPCIETSCGFQGVVFVVEVASTSSDGRGLARTGTPVNARDRVGFPTLFPEVNKSSDDGN